MQLFVLALVMALMARDWTAAHPLVDWPLGARLSAALLPYLFPALAAWMLCRRARWKLTRTPQRGWRVIKRLHLALGALRWLTLGIHLAGLFVFNFPGDLARRIGDWILINELIVLAPPLATVIFMWWAYFPIDRRLREQALLRELDQGKAVFGFHGRGAYMLEQVRHQLLLILLPLLLLVGWLETVLVVGRHVVFVHEYQGWISIAGGLGLFALAPLLIRHTWRTQPMPDGPLRRRLLDMCRDHRVGVGELLLWRTHGGLINGAVMGLVAPLRYILLTDGLIDQLRDEQIEAVMAHELGHVRRHHMPWMAICALGTLFALFIGADTLVLGLDRLGVAAKLDETWRSGAAIDGAMLAAALAGLVIVGVFAAWGGLFGYISRRFERQADTFAVQHLSRKDAAAHEGRISEHAVEAMAGALEAVARLNHQSTGQRSWRHGSIDWRVNYLRTLAGNPIDDLPIDRRVRHIRYACLVLFTASIALGAWG